MLMTQIPVLWVRGYLRGGSRLEELREGVVEFGSQATQPACPTNHLYPLPYIGLGP